MRVLRYVTPFLMLSTSLFAGEGPKMGGLFRGEFNYNSNQSAEPLGAKSGSSSTMTQQAYANFIMKGDLSDKVKLDSEVQFIATGGALPVQCMGTPIRTAQVTWWHSEMFSVAFGCAKSRSGGWDFASYNEASSIRAFNPANSISAGNPAFSYVPGEAAFNPAIELGLHMFGDLTLQIHNDGTPGTGGTGWNTRKRQTWSVEWKGEMMGIHPLIQYGAYDDGHSNHFNVGLMLDFADVGFAIDYMMVANSEKIADGTKSKSKIDNGNRLSTEISYDVKGMMRPSLYYSNYLNKVNSTTGDAGANAGPGVWNHEGQVISLSVAATGLSAHYSPYIAVDQQSGRFLVGANKKTRSDLIVRVGTTANF